MFIASCIRNYWREKLLLHVINSSLKCVAKRTINLRAFRESSTFYSPTSSFRSDSDKSSSLTVTTACDIFAPGTGFEASSINDVGLRNGEQGKTGGRPSWLNQLNFQTLNVLDLPDCISSSFHLEQRQRDTDNTEVCERI
jgi:hypothetical protein